MDLAALAAELTAGESSLMTEDCVEMLKTENAHDRRQTKDTRATERMAGSDVPAEPDCPAVVVAFSVNDGWIHREGAACDG